MYAPMTNYSYSLIYASCNFLNVDDFIRYKSPRLRVMATYNLFSVEMDIFLIENLSSASFSKSFVRITQAQSTVSPLEYDQFNAGNEYFVASL